MFTISVDVKLEAVKQTKKIGLGTFSFAGTEQTKLVAAVVKKAQQKIKDKGLNGITGVISTVVDVEINGQNFSDFKDDLINEIDEALDEPYAAKE